MSSKLDAIQTAINQASLTFNVSEDIARACMSAQIHPDVTKVLLRMHEGQKELEREVQQIQRSMLELGRVVATGADITAAVHEAVSRMGDRVGVPMNTLFGPQDDTPQST